MSHILSMLLKSCSSSELQMPLPFLRVLFARVFNRKLFSASNGQTFLLKKLFCLHADHNKRNTMALL